MMGGRRCPCSEVWDERGGGPAEGEGSEGMKDTVFNYWVTT